MTVNIAYQIFRVHRPAKEDHLQEATAKYLDTLAEAGLLRWFHPAPNVYIRGLHTAKRGTDSRSRSDNLAMILGKKGKRAGVKAGVPDIIIHSHKIAIELKYGKNTASKEQKEWMHQAMLWGWKCFVVNSAVGVIEALHSCGFTENQLRGKKKADGVVSR